jgi:hypothetical protein
VRSCQPGYSRDLEVEGSPASFRGGHAPFSGSLIVIPGKAMKPASCVQRQGVGTAARSKLS